LAKKTKFKIDLNLDSIKVKSVTIDSNGDYHIYVSCTANSTLCNKCGNKTTKSHGQCDESIIEHLPIFDHRVFIHVKWPRFKCEKCDNNNSTTSFKPKWVNKTGNKTREYENYCLKFLINSTVKDVSEKLKTTEEIIEGIINRNVKTSINWAEVNPTIIGIDEIALRKGHSHYVTIVSDLSDNKKVKILGVIDGNSKDDILPFLQSIPKKILLSLEGITIDMGASYFSALKELIKDVDRFNHIVTIDRFHVAKLLGDKVDKERKKVVKQLKLEFENDDDKLESIKGTMWPFRHHRDDLGKEGNEKLDKLFELAPSLKDCYNLREELYEIFELEGISKEDAKEKIDEWCKKADLFETKGYNPFTSFTKTYRNFEENILNYFTDRISSGPVEGLNNKIKVIKRRGFGFRNIANFAKRLFLDINYKPLLLPSLTN